MADPIQGQVTTISFKSTGSGQGLVEEMSNLGNARLAQLEPVGFEMARSGRSFQGGTSAVAGAVAAIIDLPTTTGPVVLFNSTPSSGTKVLVVRRLSFSYGSGTLGATGSTLFAGVTGGKLATPLTANGANFATQASRSAATPVGFIAAAQTVVQGIWTCLGGIGHGAATTTSVGYSVDLASHPFIVPSQFALVIGVLGVATGNYMLSVNWDEVEAILP
jgi:hypothetical protein